MRLTPAQRPVMMKVARRGRVMILGGFGGEQAPDGKDDPEFDKRCVVEWLIGAGLLAFGPGVNSYVFTKDGLAWMKARRKAA